MAYIIPSRMLYIAVIVSITIASYLEITNEAVILNENVTNDRSAFKNIHNENTDDNRPITNLFDNSNENEKSISSSTKYDNKGLPVINKDDNAESTRRATIISMVNADMENVRKWDSRSNVKSKHSTVQYISKSVDPEKVKLTLKEQFSKLRVNRRFKVDNTNELGLKREMKSVKLSVKFDKDGNSNIHSSKDRAKRDIEDEDVVIWDYCQGNTHLDYLNGEFKCVDISFANRENFGALAKCPNDTVRVILHNKVLFCRPKKKKRH